MSQIPNAKDIKYTNHNTKHTSHQYAVLWQSHFCHKFAHFLEYFFQPLYCPFNTSLNAFIYIYMSLDQVIAARQVK